MIFIDRTSVDIPEILADGSEKLKKELEKAIAHYADPNKRTKAFKFRVYSHEDVKKALIKMGKGKCAYCESDILATYVGDIEHFRPKGEIEELKATGNSKPGYYWLAADWDNLLFSCRNCNQKSKQATATVAEAKSMGKMNQFPLFDENHRVRSHEDDIEEEEKVRLLLNPCKENPEDYFKYDINSGVIKPKKRKKFLKERALSSIKVFALQRVPLVMEREKKAILISAQMQRVEEAFINYNDFINDAERAEKFAKVLQREMETLQSFLDPKEEYLGLARQMIGKFMKKNFQVDITAA
ncbi:TIGR02646 family protein [Kordia sp. TARA_039_SRF]|nr:TIGR02646 family protein [Kordia sp. TARA_039_SRF]